MRKNIIAFIMSIIMLVTSVTCFADNATDRNTADALNELGLFLGTGNGYELESSLTRAQAVTLLVRMLGLEEEAENSIYNNSFTDVPDWASGYIGCAYFYNITKGTSETTFSPDEVITDYMFLTLVLRALGYSDSGENPMYVWNDPYALAFELKLIQNLEPDPEFRRADAVSIFWNALSTSLNGTDSILADRLIEQEVFTADEFTEAKDIQENGRIENAGGPAKSDNKSESKPGRKPIIIPSSGSNRDETDDSAPEENTEAETETSPDPGAGKGEFPIV